MAGVGVGRGLGGATSSPPAMAVRGPREDPRADPRAFAERVLRRPLWPHQEEAAMSDRFVTVIAAARRTGKTTLIESLAAWTCFRESGVKAVILSSGQESARRVTEALGQTLMENDLTRGAVVDDFATRIRLGNGSEILSLPASQLQVRGLGRGVKLLVIDEAGFVRDELWRAARYIALDERGNGARIVLAGTPWGGPDMFFRKAFEAGNDGDPEHASFHWTYEASPIIDHAYLERERDRMAPAEYAAEVLGEWSDAEGALFPRSLLERQSADLLLPSIAALASPASPVVGVDWGVSFDQSAAMFVYRLPVEDLNKNAPRLPRFVAVPWIWKRGALMSDVWTEIAAVRARFHILSSETSGVGAAPSQELRRILRERRRAPRFWNPVQTTNPKKTAGYGAVLALLERGQLVLPRDPDLLRQLAGLRFEHGERGFTRIEAESAAVHDDIADALMLAMAPHTAAGVKGRVVVGLLHFAKPGGVPDHETYARQVEGIPIVETGGGLRVWQRPPLQSVADLEVTWPGVARQTNQRR
jgi:hypothetical protein